MSTAPERTLPAEIEIAIETLTNFWYSPDSFDPRGEDYPEMYVDELRQAILAALEPERVLRERCERLRQELETLNRNTDNRQYPADLFNPSILPTIFSPPRAAPTREGGKMNVREIKTYEAVCAKCGDKVRYESTYFKLPEGWKSISTGYEGYREYREDRCPQCQEEST